MIFTVKLIDIWHYLLNFLQRKELQHGDEFYLVRKKDQEELGML